MSLCRISLLLILFSQVVAQTDLRCLNSNMIHLSAVDATVDNIQRIFEAQESIDNQEACQIYLRFNSLKNQVFIRWGPAAFIPVLPSQNMWVYTTASFRYDTTAQKLRDFSYVIDINIICMSRNNCETDNIKDRFQQINSTDYATMINKVRPLMVPTGNSPESGEDLPDKNNDMHGNCSEFSCTWSTDKSNYWEKTGCSFVPLTDFPVLILKTEEKIFEKYQKSDKIPSNSREFNQHVLHFQLNIEQKCLLNQEAYGFIVKTMAESLYKQYPLWTRLKQKAVLRDENQGIKTSSSTTLCPTTDPKKSLSTTSVPRKTTETESGEAETKRVITPTKKSTAEMTTTITSTIVNSTPMKKENIAHPCSLSKTIVFLFSLVSFLNILLAT